MNVKRGEMHVMLNAPDGKAKRKCSNTTIGHAPTEKKTTSANNSVHARDIARVTAKDGNASDRSSSSTGKLRRILMINKQKKETARKQNRHTHTHHSHHTDTPKKKRKGALFVCLCAQCRLVPFSFGLLEPLQLPRLPATT